MNKWILSVLLVVASLFAARIVHPLRSAHLPGPFRKLLRFVRVEKVSIEELKRYDSKSNGTILVGILGEAFDVSEGRKFYADGNGYSCFAGRDATRAFITGEFEGEGLTDDIIGLDPEQLVSLEEWRLFYHDKYVYVGKVAGGFFFDERGQPKEGYHVLQAGIAEGRKIQEMRKAEEDKFLPCSSKWTKQSGSIVWCKEGYPRKVTIPKPRGESYQRCACLLENQLQERHEVYAGCSPKSQTCEFKVKNTVPKT